MKRQRETCMVEFERNVSKIKIQDKPFSYFFLDDAIDIAILDSFKKDVRKFEHLINLEEHTESLSPVFREGEPRGHLIGFGARSAGEISDSVFLKALSEFNSGLIPLNFLFTNLFSVSEINLKSLFFLDDLISC